MKYTHNYMKIFLDTADTEIINEYFKTGLVDGVTTNPTLIMKSGRNPEDVYQDIKDIGVRDISMEVVGSAAQMYHEARRLHDNFGDVCTVKLPMTRDGLSVCKELSDMNIKVNVTLIFCAAQAVLAAKAGATYVSPFVGRLDDQSVAGLEVVRSSLNCIVFTESELRFLLHLFVVSNVLLGHGIMVLKFAPCHLKCLTKCMTISLPIKVLRFSIKTGHR